MNLKIITAATLLLANFSFAQIDEGRYKAQKIQCKSGKTLKLGGKFMIYDIYLEIKDNRMTMTAIAKSGDWAPFRLNCTQLNQGNFTYTKENTYEGELPNISVSCNSPAWTAILQRKLFGVEEFGEFTYAQSAGQLIIHNSQTVTKYSCDAPGDYPIYYYQKI